MPSKTVLIVWDMPSEKYWLAEDNISLALHAYCPNTQFQVYPEEAIATNNYYKSEIRRLAKFLREHYPSEVAQNIEAPFEISSAVDLALQLLSSPTLHAPDNE
jgi:hypothetical protein